MMNAIHHMHSFKSTDPVAQKRHKTVPIFWLFHWIVYVIFLFIQFKLKAASLTLPLWCRTTYFKLTKLIYAATIMIIMHILYQFEISKMTRWEGCVMTCVQISLPLQICWLCRCVAASRPNPNSIRSVKALKQTFWVYALSSDTTRNPLQYSNHIMFCLQAIINYECVKHDKIFKGQSLRGHQSSSFCFEACLTKSHAAFLQPHTFLTRHDELDQWMRPILANRWFCSLFRSFLYKHLMNL